MAICHLVPMIIDSLGQQAKTNLKSERAEFSVSADKAKKFLHIAVRNLYSNPVLASIVEVSQNANDEHVRRGIKSKPFHVTIPTSWSPTFSVRDFGAGISHEYMLNGYTQALESTKDSDSEMSGGWGLGRLALLSLASTYNVTTYIDSKERNYSIFESEKGIEIIMTHERATTEPNGTLVSAPVPTDKVSQFRDSANRAFRYYEVKPTLKGDSNFKLDIPTFALKGEGWAIEVGGGTTSAVCGIYHYPIQANNIPNLTSVQQSLLGNIGLVMFFGASDLAPMANRQGLYYNDKTNAAIKKRLSEIEISAVAEIQKSFDKCASYYEAKMLYGEMFHGQSVNRIASIFKSSSKIVWNNIPVGDNVVMALDKIVPKTVAGEVGVTVTAFEWKWRRGGHKVAHTHGYTAFNISKSNVTFINDLPGNRGFINRAKSYLRELKNTNGSSECNQVNVITFLDANAKAEFHKQTHLNDADFQKISSVVVVKLAREQSSAQRAKTKVFTWNGDTSCNRSQYSKCWDIAEIDLEEEEEGVYIALDRFVPFFKNCDSMNKMASVVNFLKAQKFIPDDFKLYGFRNNSDEYTAIQSNPDWVSLEQLVAKFVNSYVIPKEEIQILSDADEYGRNYYNQPFSSVFTHYYTKVDDAKIENISNQHLKDYLKKFYFLYKQNDKKSANDYDKKHTAFINLGGSINKAGVEPTHELTNLTKQLNSDIPMMKFIKSISDFNEVVALDALLK